MKKSRKIGRLAVLGTLVFLGVCTVRILLGDPMPERECLILENSPCRIYYLLNLDGMKGLGHSALLLVDRDGYGQVCSYNGMQYNLLQCLMGKEGIGKMKQFYLKPEEVDILLCTGSLQAGAYEECDNFDRALYRCLSEEEYEQIWQGIAFYVEVGDEFEQLYANLQNADEDMRSDAEGQMAVFLNSRDVPRYQIYTHNCDTVARELIALADEELAAYNISNAKLTPNGNYKNMRSSLSAVWGYRCLGEDSLPERLLE